LTLGRLLIVMNTGADLKNLAPPVPAPGHDLLQVMPWPVFSRMSAREKRAIYEYLSAIPCIPGQPDIPATGRVDRCEPSQP